MELVLTRIAKRKTYTIGRLAIKKTHPQPLSESEGSGQTQVSELSTPLPHQREGTGESLYFCDTLEPTWRDYAHGGRKIKGCSAIPEGRYAVVISYSPKFEQWLPILLGGPEFNKQWQGIRIHAGNTAADTEGCILVGKNKLVGQVVDSRIWLHRLKNKIVEAKNRGEAVWITIK
jgi:hypothetical protein